MIDENVYSPPTNHSYGMMPQNIERPGCGHMQTLDAYIQHGAISLAEQKRMQKELKKPCPTCLKEKKK